jgi:hypothetical protein
LLGWIVLPPSEVRTTEKYKPFGGVSPASQQRSGSAAKTPTMCISFAAGRKS